MLYFMTVILMSQMLVMILGVLISVAFFSLFERKMMGIIQARKGPNKISFMGLLQPIADAMKLITKNEGVPYSSSPLIYSTVPMVFLIVSLCYWLPTPIKGTWFLIQSSSLFIMFWMSISVYMIIFLGWFSYSKYSMIGSTRSVIQSISYEIVLSFIVLCMCMMSSSINMKDFMKFQELVWTAMPMVMMIFPMFISILAETNRSPFDLTEGESELVSGYCVEYGGLSYTMIFLSENSSVLFMSIFMSVLFAKMSWIMIITILMMFVWIRATLPRIRFDKMMNVCWVVMLPLMMSLIMVVTCLMYELFTMDC